MYINLSDLIHQLRSFYMNNTAVTVSNILCPYTILLATTLYTIIVQFTLIFFLSSSPKFSSCSASSCSMAWHISRVMTECPRDFAKGEKGNDPHMLQQNFTQIYFNPHTSCKVPTFFHGMVLYYMLGNLISPR